MTKGNDSLHFFYDAQNRSAVVVYNGTVYAYVKNLQGDIIAILDSAGTAVVSYTYDAWGAPTGTAGSMAATLGHLNPFRYRGYVYDEETGLYYLRSRYYNASLCRFINTDSIFANVYHVGALNILSYCFNSPITHIDPSGCTVIPMPPPSLTGELLRALGSALLKGAAGLLTLILAGLGINAIDEATSDSNSDATPTPSQSPVPTPHPAPTPGSTNVPTPAPAVYYLAYTIDNGAPIHFGAPMTLSQARHLIVSEKIVSVIRQEIGGKGTKLPAWGIWTLEESDARRLADKLGNTGIHYEEDNIYHLPHYHCMVNEKVHIWFAR